MQRAWDELRGGRSNPRLGRPQDRGRPTDRQEEGRKSALAQLEKVRATREAMEKPKMDRNEDRFATAKSEIRDHQQQQEKAARLWSSDQKERREGREKVIVERWREAQKANQADATRSLAEGEEKKKQLEARANQASREEERADNHARQKQTAIVDRSATEKESRTHQAADAKERLAQMREQRERPRPVDRQRSRGDDRDR